MIFIHFLQYHWMPFLIATFIIPYYIPYVLHRSINSDLISLKNAIKQKEPDVEGITRHFFNAFRHPTINSCWVVLCNLLIKILYIAVNVGVFLSLDYLLNNNFKYYGNEWVKWSGNNNTVQFDYMDSLRNSPRPGNMLLPSFGYCQLYSSAKDIKESVINKHKLICEISQHVLYQYVLLVLWGAILVGIIVSIVGLFLLIVHYLYSICVRFVCFFSSFSLSLLLFK